MGNMKPQITPSEFYKQIEPHRYHFAHFGVYVVDSEWEFRTSHAPIDEVKSIDEILRDVDQIKDAEDILEGMVFISHLSQENIVVLAQRCGYVMCKNTKCGSTPKLIYWKELVEKYELTYLFEQQLCSTF